MKRLHPTIVLILVGFFLFAAPAGAQQYNESNDFSYALKLFNEGFYDISARQFSTFVNNYPSSDKLADAKYYLAESLYRIKEYPNARVEFQSLAVTFPDHERAPYAWKMVGELYRILENHKDAAKAFETVKVLYPDHSLAPPSLLKAAEAYIAEDMFTQADRLLKEFLDRYVNSPEYPEGHLIYGVLLAKKGEFEQAAGRFERAIALSKDNAIAVRANLGLGNVYRKLGLLNKAANYYQNVIQINAGGQTGFEAIVSLAKIHQDMGEWDKAIALLERHKKNFVGDANQFQLGVALAQSHFFKRDYPAARRILENLPTSSLQNSQRQLIHFYTAACFQEEGKTARAIEAYEQVIRMADQDTTRTEYAPASYVNMIKLYLRNANIQKAHQYLTEFARTYPARSLQDNSEIDDLYVALIEKAFETGNISFATTQLQKFINEFPGSHLMDELLYTAGNAFFESGDFSQSRDYFSRLIRNYHCSENSEEAREKLNFINNYLVPEHAVGVSELARLIHKMLSGDDRTRILLDLGIIYLKDLKDYQAAAQIFEQCKSQTSDSAIVGAALYYLSESYMAQARIDAFPHLPQNELYQKAVQNLKLAMEYREHAPYPDSLMFRFLVWTIPPENSNSPKTLEFWTHFEKSFPTSALLPQARLRIAEISAANGDTARAIDYLDKIIASGKAQAQGSHGSFMVGKAYWQRAEILERNGKRQSAIETLKDFLRNITPHPYEARAYWRLAEFHAGIGDYASAAKFLERLLQLYSYTGFARNAPGQIVDYYISAGDYINAFSYIQSQLKDIPPMMDPIVKHYRSAPNVNFYFYAGKARYQVKEYQQARSDIIQYLALSGNPHFRPEAFYLLGKIAAEEGSDESALLYFSLISATESPFFFNKANEIAADILFTNGNYSEARKKYESVIPTTNDINQKIYLEAQRLRCLVNEGDAKQFGAEYSGFQRNYKNHPELDSYLASVEFEQGKNDYFNKNFDRALNHFSTILKKYKNSGYADDALYYQGLCYTTLNKVDDALNRLTKFLKDYPNSLLLGDVYNSIANLYIRGEKTDLAMGALQKAVETASTPESERNAVANLIRLYKNLGMWDNALQLSRQYVDKFPNADDIIDKKILIGICLTNLNRYSEAVDYLKQVKFEATSEQEPEVQFYIGEAYFNAGRYEEAIGEFVKIPLLSKKTKLQWEASALYYSGQAYEKLARLDDAVRMYKEIVERPGILLELKREAQRRIDFLTNQ